MRRTNNNGDSQVEPSFNYGELDINFARRQITLAGESVTLTPTEYNLLRELVTNAGKVLTHTHLLNSVWGAEYQEEREYFHVFIRRLRTKFERNSADSRYIVTIPGVGYHIASSIA